MPKPCRVTAQRSVPKNKMKILPILEQPRSPHAPKNKKNPEIELPPPHRSAPPHTKTRARAKYPVLSCSPPMPYAAMPISLFSLFSAKFIIYLPKTIILNQILINISGLCGTIL